MLNRRHLIATAALAAAAFAPLAQASTAIDKTARIVVGFPAGRAADAVPASVKTVVPTFAESGFKDVAAEEFFAVFMPAKTPADVLAKLNAAIQKALKAKALIEGLEKLSFEVEGQSPAEFSKIVRGELDRWGPVVKASGFSSED